MLDLNAITGSNQAVLGENSLRRVHMRVSVLSRLLFSLLLVALAASSLFGGVDRQSGDYSFKLSLLQEEEEPDGKVCVEQTYCLRIKMVDGHGEASQKVQLRSGSDRNQEDPANVKNSQGRVLSDSSLSVKLRATEEADCFETKLNFCAAKFGDGKFEVNTLLNLSLAKEVVVAGQVVEFVEGNQRKKARRVIKVLLDSRK